MDLSMPRLNGVEAIRGQQRQHRHPHHLPGRRRRLPRPARRRQGLSAEGR
jgi:CheY-like chemotaxis protein